MLCSCAEHQHETRRNTLVIADGNTSRTMGSFAQQREELASGANRTPNKLEPMAVPTKGQKYTSGAERACSVAQFAREYDRIRMLENGCSVQWLGRVTVFGRLQGGLERRAFVTTSTCCSTVRQEAKKDGVQQDGAPKEMDGMFTRRAQPSPDGRKEGFFERTLIRGAGAVDGSVIAS
jgi:hypothetical protein